MEVIVLVRNTLSSCTLTELKAGMGLSSSPHLRASELQALFEVTSATRYPRSVPWKECCGRLSPFFGKSQLQARLVESLPFWRRNHFHSSTKVPSVKMCGMRSLRL
jgi:hypothetical protein